jgi:glycosyltransferase involved in cell wall biosynthesis
MPAKVLMLGWGFPPNVTGGLDTAVGELYEAFRARDDVEIEIVLPEKFAPDREGLLGVPTGDGDIIERVGEMTETFVERAAHADVVHTHDWFGYEPGSSAKDEHGVPWITSFHSLSSDRNLQPPRREVRTEKAVVKESDHLISVSEFTRRKVNEEYGRDSTVIYNGFTSVEPTGRDVKADLGIEGPMLFFVGRHTDQKGLSYLVYAMSKLDRDDVTLVLGGTGHLTDQLKRFTRLLGIEDRVMFVGYIDQEDLGDYYASADLFVSPSLAEPFGLTLVEALSVGTRVVASRSGVAEILPDDVLIEVEPESDSIVRGIQRGLALDTPLEYDINTWAEVADEHVAFYKQAIEAAETTADVDQD